MKLISPAILGLGAICLVVAAALGWLLLNGSPSPAPGATADIGGPFQLTNQSGQRVDQNVLKGRWSLVFFGYVSCPDICPATMQTIAAAETRLNGDAKKLQVVFITVDPARDTPSQLKAWLDQPGFPRPAMALTGTEAEIAAAAKVYRVFYKKEGTGEGYQMAHSAAIYLMDPQGHFAVPLYYEQGPEKLAKDIAAALRKG